MSLSNEGNLSANGTITASSDIKLKKNIETITNALEKVNQLNGVEYDRIDIKDHQIGLIAQEVEKVIPDVVYDNDGTKSVAYQNLVALLIQAIKELNNKVDKIENKN
jgi:3-dehydroquinate synthase class II